MYDNATHRQLIYLNGIVDGSRAASSLQTAVGNFTIAGSTNTSVHYSGRLDHFIITERAKTACALFIDANLACQFTFDSLSLLEDSGPNDLTAVSTGSPAMTITGRVNQGMLFSLSLSFVTILGISAPLSSNTESTLSMWINPTTLGSGATLIYISTQSDGQSSFPFSFRLFVDRVMISVGQGTCMAMWGLTSAGLVSVNIMDTTVTILSATASSALPLNTWAHIAQTSSTVNGSRLYMDGVLVTTTSAPLGHAIGPFAFIRASPSGTIACPTGLIVAGQFLGSVDEVRLFGRELTTNDLCRLTNP